MDFQLSNFSVDLVATFWWKQQIKGGKKRKKRLEEPVFQSSDDSKCFDYRRAKALLISGIGTDAGKHSGRKTGG